MAEAKKLEVLVVDDDHESYVPRFRRAFNGRVEFTPAGNAGAALRLAHDHKYDAVVLDHDPPINGYQTAFKIKATTDNELIIGFSEKWEAEEARELGLYYFSGVEANIAQIIAKLLKMDRQTYEREVKPHFDSNGKVQ